MSRSLANRPTLLRAAEPTAYAPRTNGLSTIAPPVIFAHRFGGNVVPEETIEAARAITAQGAKNLDCDVATLGDGSLCVMHDATTARTTTDETSNTADLSAGRVQALVADAGTWFGGGWGNCRIPSFADICREFGNKIFISVEAKDTGGGAAIVRHLQQFGISIDHALVSSFISAELTAAVAAGYPTMILSGDASVTPAACVAAGYKWIGVSSATSGGSTPSAIAGYHAVGVKVAVYTINRQMDAAAWVAAGVDGIFSDDPLYITDVQPVRTTDPFASKAFWNGQFLDATRTNKGVWSGTNEWGWSDAPNQNDNVTWGWGVPKLKANADTVQINFSLAFDSFFTASTTNWAAINLLTDDRNWLNGASYGGSGYSFYIRGDGRLRIYRIDGGVTTQIQDTPTVGVPTIGAFLTGIINITPTTVRLRRTDVASSPAAVTDATYRGLYYPSGHRFGAAARFKAVSLV